MPTGSFMTVTIVLYFLTNKLKQKPFKKLVYFKFKLNSILTRCPWNDGLATAKGYEYKWIGLSFSTSLIRSQSDYF